MSEPKEKVDISDLKDAFLECPVCVEHFNQTDRRPRLLHSCLHAFCAQCLQQLIQKEGKSQITCPLCRQIQTVTGDVKSLPIDPVRDQLVEYLQITHKQKVLCKDCPDENSAKSRCLECGDNLCQDCEYVHRRHRSSRSHRVVPVQELEKESCGTLKMRHFCATHSDRVVECFCENCEVLCCLLCAVIDHKGHDFKKLDDAASNKIKEIELSLTDLEKVYDKLTTAKSDCEAHVSDVESDKEKLTSEINEKFDTAEQLLRERRGHLLKEVEESSEKMKAVAKKNASLYDDTLTEIKSIQTYFSNAKCKTDEVSLLQTYPSLKKNVSNLTNTDLVNIKKCTERIAFDAVDETNVHKYINGFGAVRSIETDKGRSGFVPNQGPMFPTPYGAYPAPSAYQPQMKHHMYPAGVPIDPRTGFKMLHSAGYQGQQFANPGGAQVSAHDQQDRQATSVSTTTYVQQMQQEQQQPRYYQQHQQGNRTPDNQEHQSSEDQKEKEIFQELSSAPVSTTRGPTKTQALGDSRKMQGIGGPCKVQVTSNMPELGGSSKRTRSWWYLQKQ